ncbi:Hypothetical_protein [Hexamita inflata]|uniref:Hypothetical_protein n=1 Tax=Hexamita inflata TaxID=28002 RepID=A0AA86PSC0_9EUKA|nr:Hypothetical protein HINF_LOCUS32496 [Hexamita inflata]
MNEISELNRKCVDIQVQITQKKQIIQQLLTNLNIPTETNYTLALKKLDNSIKNEHALQTKINQQQRLIQKLNNEILSLRCDSSQMEDEIFNSHNKLKQLSNTVNIESDFQYVMKKQQETVKWQEAHMNILKNSIATKDNIILELVE